MKTTRDDMVEEYRALIRVLGEEKIEKAYFILRSMKISFATMRNFIRNQKIMNSIKEGIPPDKIASTNGVSKMTVYRHLKTVRKK